MKQIVVLSGKGGTGKTSITAALVDLAAQEKGIVIADVDVDAANLGLVLGPEQISANTFKSGSLAQIDAATCISCGECEIACRFGAVMPGKNGAAYQIDPLACEGCNACVYRCPVEAISTTKPVAGEWYEAKTAFGPLYHARLAAGGENSGQLVTLVKQQARLRALDDESQLLLIDGPPGIGCPVISAVSGADLALLVVEPTLSGAHDLDRILATTIHFGVAAEVIINKADLSTTRTRELRAFCQEQQVPIVGEIPYDTTITEAMVQGQAITQYQPESSGAKAIAQIWGRIGAWLDAPREE